MNNGRSYNRWVNKNILDSKLPTSRSIRNRSRDWILGEHRCVICEKLDNEINLHRAGEHTVGRDKDVSYLRNKKKEWKILANTPGYENLQAILSTGDLRTRYFTI